MKIIGITGGVGAGKTQVLSYIGENYNCRIIRADETAHLLYEKGRACYQALVELFGNQILDKNDVIDKKKMAELIFHDRVLLDKVNAIIHPAVKQYILEQISEEKEKKRADYFFIEAALLIEEHYDQIADELWYIHSDVDVRKERLVRSRQYSEQKIADIMQGQLSEEEFRRHCQRVITNNGNLEETYQQIKRIMGDEV